MGRRLLSFEALQSIAHRSFGVVPFPETLIIGGVARAMAARAMGMGSLPWGVKCTDVDMVVFSVSPHQWARWTRRLPVKALTRFGSTRFFHEGVQIDVMRFGADQDIHYHQAPSANLLTYTDLIPPFSCDRFGLTRDMSLVCPADALRTLRARRLELRVGQVPQVPEWAARRITSAIEAGWSIDSRCYALAKTWIYPDWIRPEVLKSARVL